MKMGITRFADLTSDEFGNHHTSYDPSVRKIGHAAAAKAGAAPAEAAMGMAHGGGGRRCKQPPTLVF